MYLKDLECCGIKELDGIKESENTAKRSVLYIAGAQRVAEKEDDGDEFAFIIFSDTYSAPRGKALANYITKNKPGSIRKTLSRENPNSGNDLTVWVWAIHQNNLKAWFKKNK